MKGRCYMERISKTIAAYDKHCDAYNGKFKEFEPYVQKIKEFIKLLEPGMKVLDLGCGPGNVSRQLMLSGKEFSIEGIDLSEEMAKLARKNVPSGKFTCRDLRDISFPEESFDAILLSFCIVHLNETEMADLLEKVSRYLKQEGILYLSFMEGKKDGFEKTSFSEEELFFYYHSSEKVEEILKDNHLIIDKLTKQGYLESDGSVTTDVFIFAKKGNQDKVLKNFGKRAAEYRLSSTHGNPTDLDRMNNLINPQPDEIALDVATGGGHTAIALAKCVKNVVAIDITQEMLAEAQKAASLQGLSNITFQAEDVHCLTVTDEQFDIVSSRFAVHHFFDVKKALQEMCRVLKPEGKLYILDCSVFDGDETEREINRLELLRDSSHQFSYSPRLWLQLLKELPLTIEQTSLLREQYELPQWFDRMGTSQDNRDEIFKILRTLSEESKVHYPFGDDYITTYRFEILATKNK